MHLSRYLNFWYRRRGDQPALHCEDETLSWTDVEHASAALAAYLTDIGVTPGDRIGCPLGTSQPWCVQFVDSLRMGPIFVPHTALFCRFELDQIAADAADRTIVV